MSLTQLLLVTSLLAFSALGAFDAYILYPKGATNCDGQYSTIVAYTSIACVATACSCSPNVGCFALKCAQAQLPAQPSNAIVSAVYAKADCTGDPTIFTATVNDQCYAPGNIAPSTKISCTNGNFTTSVYATSGTCTGNPTSSISVNIGAAPQFCQSGTYYSCGPVTPTSAPTVSISDTNTNVNAVVVVSQFTLITGVTVNSISYAVFVTATTAGRISFDVTLQSGVTTDMACERLKTRLLTLAPVLTRSPCNSKCLVCKFTSKRGEDASGEMSVAPAYAGVASNTASLFAFLLVLLCFIA